MLPLAGLRIVVTRAAHQADELAQRLAALGAEVVRLPLIAVAPPEDPEPLRSAASHADEYDWIIFTSTNAVASFAAELPHPAAECSTRIACIGTATGECAERNGFTVALLPDRFVAESLVDALGRQDLRGRRILIPSAAVTRDVLPSELRKRGAEVHVVEAYRNILPPEAALQAPGVFAPPYPDWVTFASPSAVDHLVSLLEPSVLGNVRIATIGPSTSLAVRRHGLAVSAEARVQTAEGLVDAIGAACTHSTQ